MALKPPKALILNPMKLDQFRLSQVRRVAAAWAILLARISFGVVVLLAPFRLRMVLVARPTPPVYADYTDFLLFASDIALLMTLVLWLISLALAPRAVRFGPRHIWIPLVGLMLAGGISTVASYDARLSAYHAIRLLALFWFYAFIVNEIHSPVWLFIPVGMQVVAQSIVALAQFMKQQSVGLLALGELSLAPSSSGVSVIASGGARLLRAYGLTDHPNILGGCLAFGLLLLLRACLRPSRRLAAWAAFLPGIAALVVAFSRSAWLAFAAGALVIFTVELAYRRWANIRRGLWLAAACAVIVSAIILAYPRFFGMRLNAGNSFTGATQEQQSIGQRIILVGISVPILRDHPLTGVGLGAAPLALKAYYPSFDLNYEPPHWALFDSALETGVLGAASYLALLIFPIYFFIRNARKFASAPLVTAAFALLIGITVVGFFDYYTWLLEPGRLWQWLGWGFWAVVTERSRR